MKTVLLSVVTMFALVGCSHSKSSKYQADFKVSQESVVAGTQVSAKGTPLKLYKGTLKVGDKLQATLKSFNTKGRVAIVNIVPSVDTPVCESQTHELGESTSIPASVMRYTVSRDLPMAQKRFAREAKLTNIIYVSDYKNGTFGRSSGLMIQGEELLARAVLVTDKNGVIRHLQIVPDITTLPDLKKAIIVAKGLL